MTIKFDLANQVRQTVLPRWRPLLPLFEAMMNSFQAIRDAKLPKGVRGEVKIEVERERSLFEDSAPAVTGFIISDNGIGLDDENFDSFNTAYSPKKSLTGGKGIGRITWLKAFDQAQVMSTFISENGDFLHRNFKFDKYYDLDERGIPRKSTNHARGTTVHLIGLHREYRDQVPRSADILIQKIIEHFILILLEPDCPKIVLVDGAILHDLNQIFDQEYRATASNHEFKINDFVFTMHGFRLPTSRTTKHKLVYAADQRAVQSDKLEEYIPNLKSRLEDSTGRPFFLSRDCPEPIS